MMGVSLGRRAFLTGRSAAPGAARIGAGCLQRQGIVCQACGDACVPRAVRFLPLPGALSQAVVDPARCTGCGYCISVCPAAAISLDSRLGAAGEQRAP